jgi:hypothetical protein
LFSLDHFSHEINPKKNQNFNSFLIFYINKTSAPKVCNELVSMPVGISPVGRGVIAPSHVIIITKTQFGRTGWEIEEEEEEEEQMKGREQQGGK